MNLLPLLQAAGANAGKGGGWSTLLFFLAIILICYFFMIRPQQKKQKKIEEMRNGLQRGDKVVTIGGIHGKIADVKENTFLIEIANDVRIEFEKSAVNIDERAAKNNE